MTSRSAGVAEIWAEAERVAPQCSTMAQVGRVVDSVIDETLSDSRWRGMLKDFPRHRERVRKLLHTARKHAHADSGDYRYYGTMTNGNVAPVKTQLWPGDDVATLRSEVAALRAEVAALRAALLHMVDAVIANQEAIVEMAKASAKMAKTMEEWTGE